LTFRSKVIVSQLDQPHVIAGSRMLMDNLGLAALGLLDLQCHYRDLASGEVAAVLANTGYYIYENGVDLGRRACGQGGPRRRHHHVLGVPTAWTQRVGVEGRPPGVKELKQALPKLLITR
jgi:Domain of unknown function (DUF4261)